MLGEDVKDQRGAVNDPRAGQLLQVALLRWRNLIVGDDEINTLVAADQREVTGAALAQVEVGGGGGQALGERADDLGPRRAGQRGQLRQ